MEHWKEKLQTLENQLRRSITEKTKRVRNENRENRLGG